MQNFNDVLNGITDGTKDVTVSALTANGAANLKAAVTLGASTSNDLTISGALASTIAIKTTNTYDLGSATKGLAGVYLGTGSTQTARIVATATFASARTYTLLDAGAAANFVLSEGTATVNGAKTFTNLAGCTATGVTLFPDGTAALPSIALTNATTTGLYKFGANALGFATNASTVGNVSSGGAWTIGGAGVQHNIQGGGASAHVLQISGVASGDVGNRGLIIQKVDNNSTTAQKYVLFQINAGGANCGGITANGANTAAFETISDRRLKDSITPLTGELARICSLKPVSFVYKDVEGVSSAGPGTGFIAQDMEEVYPESVATDASPEQYKSIVGWSATEARLVAAIQELAAKVDAKAS